MTEPVRTPPPPYWAVTFTTRRSEEDEAGYREAAARMEALAAERDGFLGIESVFDPESRVGITISYWTSEDAIRGWRADVEHTAARARGVASWYDAYELRVCRVERASSFARSSRDDRS